MTAIEWSDDYLIGIPEIDNQHKCIVRVANNLFVALHKKEDKAETKALFEELIEILKVHLSIEEALLRLNDYKDYMPHKEVHNSMRAVMADIDARFTTGQEVETKLIEFLKYWLMDHIAGMDKAFAKVIAPDNFTIKWNEWFSK